MFRSPLLACVRLKVNPEVSSLDYANAVTVQGLTVPGLSSRRVQTEVELVPFGSLQRSDYKSRLITR